MPNMVPQLRALLRHLFIYTLYFTGALARAKRRIATSNGTVVLTFHRVLPKDAQARTLSPAGMIVSDSTFADLVRYLSDAHQIVTLAEPKTSSNSSRIPVALTFDDGWSDNGIYAQPILASRNAAATIFLCPQKMGQDLPFWPERLAAFFHAATRNGKTKEFFDSVVSTGLSVGASLTQLIDAVKKLTPDQRDSLLARLEQLLSSEIPPSPGQLDSTMTWDVARHLSASQIAFGSHTLHHEILTHVSLGMAEVEISESGKNVTEEIGKPCFAFAYPNGDWSPAVRKLVASAGYRLAFANSPGIWWRQSDPLTIPRVNLWEGSLIGPSGRFSRPHFDYVAFWRATRASSKHPQ
jgi:peptidoglycan/xylan/chitin deacetylase (PgdA/CDA1 family)